MTTRYTVYTQSSEPVANCALLYLLYEVEHNSGLHLAHNVNISMVVQVLSEHQDHFLIKAGAEPPAIVTSLSDVPSAQVHHDRKFLRILYGVFWFWVFEC